MNIDSPHFVPTHPNIVELDRIGDQIAELSAHLDAATARLLDLIRGFDARDGRTDFPAGVKFGGHVSMGSSAGR